MAGRWIEGARAVGAFIILLPAMINLKYKVFDNKWEIENLMISYT